MTIPFLKRFKTSEVWRNLFKMLSSATLAQVFPILVYPFLTRIFTPEKFGLLALYQSIYAVLIIPATGRYEFAVMLPEKDRDAMNILGFGTLLSVTVSLLLLLVAILFPAPLARMLGDPDIQAWLPWIPLSVFFAAFCLLLTYWANRKKEFNYMATYNISQSMGIAFGKLGFGYGGMRSGGLIAGTLFGQALSTIQLGWQLLRKYRSYLTEINWKEMFAQAKKYINFPKFRMLHAMTNVFSASLPVFIFTSYFSPAIAGYWSIAFGVVYKPITVFASSITQVFSQRMIERSNKGEIIYKQVKELILRLLLIGIVPFGIAAVIAPTVFGFVFGHKWYISGVYLRLILPWLLTVYLTAPLAFIADLAGQQRIQFGLAFANLVLRFIALVIGILTKNILLALGLLSVGGVIVNIYYLLWYLSLSKKVLRVSDTYAPHESEGDPGEA